MTKEKVGETKIREIDGKNILVVDGNIESLRNTADVLRQAGYSVITTPSSERAIRLIQKSCPVLLVVSKSLNGFDGIEVCRLLQEKLNYDFPILFYSSDTSESTILQAYESGIRDYLVKPSPPGLLKAKVRILVDEPSPDMNPIHHFNDEIMAGETFFPSYKIIEKIGSGSTGHVYRAIHKITMETVAIKVLLPTRVQNIREIQRFFRGSLIGLEMPAHPNIVQVKEVKKGENRIFQVMEYIDGRTLYDLIKSERILDEAETLNVLEDICNALDHLDQNQVLHRDVKPGNIFINRAWECKLGDLGISRRLIDRTATTTGLVVGTPGYLAPEQVLDIRPLDIRADLFSLGLTVFHAVTGNNPYERNTAYKSMVARLEGSEANLMDTPEMAPQLSHTVREIISTMIRRRASDRYATPGVVLERIHLYRESL